MESGDISHIMLYSGYSSRLVKFFIFFIACFNHMVYTRFIILMSLYTRSCYFMQLFILILRESLIR